MYNIYIYIYICIYIGMVTALSPFAFKNVTKNQETSSIYLSLAYQLSSVLLVCGKHIYVYIFII
jgi:hypothetical protein